MLNGAQRNAVEPFGFAQGEFRGVKHALPVLPALSDRGCVKTRLILEEWGEVVKRRDEAMPVPYSPPKPGTEWDACPISLRISAFSHSLDGEGTATEGWHEGHLPLIKMTVSLPKSPRQFKYTLSTGLLSDGLTSHSVHGTLARTRVLGSQLTIRRYARVHRQGLRPSFGGASL
jgi:hypothetical protein